MGQTDVLKILEKNKAWMNVNQITKLTDFSQTSIRKSLNKLYSREEIERETIIRKNIKNGNRTLFIWRSKNV